MLNRFSFNLNRTVLKKTVGPFASVSEFIGVYIFTLRMCLRILPRLISMIVVLLLYAWKNTSPSVHVVSIPVFISALKIIPEIFVDTSWILCPATFSTSLS